MKQSQDPRPGHLEQLIEARLSPLDLIEPYDTLAEKLIHLVLNGRGPLNHPLFEACLGEIKNYPTRDTKVVVLGGGTGLSGIIGGDSKGADWWSDPFQGLKAVFSSVRVVVCTTDDGGSSGFFLKHLPLIAVGDIRRVMLSCCSREQLRRLYRIASSNLKIVARTLQIIFNYRFTGDDRQFLENPLLLVPEEERVLLPLRLRSYLLGLGRFFAHHPELGQLALKQQCLGNILIIAAIYQTAATRKETEQNNYSNANKREGSAIIPEGARTCPQGQGPEVRRSAATGGIIADPGDTYSVQLPNDSAAQPSDESIIAGIHELARMIGAGDGLIFPASTSPAQLKFLYSHGVMATGEDKSAHSRRLFPVDRVFTESNRPPWIDARVIEALSQADIIIYAPGSLYTSLIPILQIPAIAYTIAANQKALKLLAANFWVQGGETDISQRDLEKKFYVSDLIEAYARNIAVSARKLFHKVIIADLSQLPGDVIKNYAMEGKSPIYADKERLRQMGYDPVEAHLFNLERIKNAKMIKHDPSQFAQVVKTLYYLQQQRPDLAKPCPFEADRTVAASTYVLTPRPLLADYFGLIRQCFHRKDIADHTIREIMPELLWKNRDILLAHLDFIEGIEVIPDTSWQRATTWDNILGYFDLNDRKIKIRSDLIQKNSKYLIEAILIGLGEALLGNYFIRKELAPLLIEGERLGKLYSLELRPAEERRAFLAEADLRTFLELAKMQVSAKNPQRYLRVINRDENFTPPGLLFGLTYAWYLNNDFGDLIDYEMSILRWKKQPRLIPKNMMELRRKRALIDYFRRTVFLQPG